MGGLTGLFGKRLWLSMGVMMHLGIEVSMNVGTFVQVMVAIYPAFMSGAGRDGLAVPRAVGAPEGSCARRSWSAWRPGCSPQMSRSSGERRPTRVEGRSVVIRLASLACRGPVRGVSALVSRAPWVVLYAPDEASMTRGDAAVLGCHEAGV